MTCAGMWTGRPPTTARALASPRPMATRAWKTPSSRSSPSRRKPRDGCSDFPPPLAGKAARTAQVLAAIIGAAFVIGLQVAAILSYGTLSRADVLQSQTLEAL